MTFSFVNNYFKDFHSFFSVRNLIRRGGRISENRRKIWFKATVLEGGIIFLEENDKHEIFEYTTTVLQ